MKKALLIVATLVAMSFSCICSAWTKATMVDITRLTAAAKNGDAKAQAELGDAYYFGFSLKKDEKRAVEWWKKAADQNDAFAEYRLGELYGDDGSGDRYGTIPPNNNEAIMWFEKAASHGSPLAKCSLGWAYEHGVIGLSRNHDKAIGLWKECLPRIRVLAKDGDVDAELMLSLAYDEGLGVEQDKTEAFKWRLRNANQGFSLGQISVAIHYYSGIGTGKNLTEAARWMTLAADQGDPLAQFWLGVLYAKGEGVPKDPVKAYMWCDLALVQGLKKAGDPLVGISTQLTYDKLQEATKLSQEWQAKHLASH